MLSERREAIWIKSLFVEMMELWARAEPPARLIPESVVVQRQRQYFRWRLEEALEVLWVDSEPLAEVLEEILLLVNGAEVIINWVPPALAETLLRINEPLTSCIHAAHS
jgi:hypothetical protein